MMQFLRRLRSTPMLSTVNIGGLALAMTAVMAVALIVRFETTFNHFLPGHEQIYRISTEMEMPGRPAEELGTVPSGLAEMLSTERSIFKAIARVLPTRAQIVIQGEERSISAVIADPDFFSVLEFPVLEGDTSTGDVLDPNTVVLTRSLAAQLFGPDARVGEHLEVVVDGERRLLSVSAIIGDPPAGSTLRFQAVISDLGRQAAWRTRVHDPENWDTELYVRLLPAAEVASLSSLLEGLAPGAVRLSDGRGRAWLNAHAVGGLRQSGNINLAAGPFDTELLTSLTLIAAAVLGVAIINSTNLLTAQAVRRGREIGVRKTFGASRFSLFLRFMAEAVVMSTVAALIGLFFFELIWPTLADLINQPELRASELPLWERMLFVSFIALGAGALGGFYPAVVMARWRPVDVFRRSAGPAGTTRVRNALLAGQFAATIGIIITTMTVVDQIRHVQTVTAGERKADLLILTVPYLQVRQDSSGLADQWQPPSLERMIVARDLIAREPEVAAVTITEAIPSLPNRRTGMFRLADGDASDFAPLPSMGVDSGFLDVYGIEVRHGSNIRTTNYTENSSAVAQAVISADAALRLGLTDPSLALGEIVITDSGSAFEIVGVVDNVVLGNAHEPQVTFLLHSNPMFANNIIVRFASSPTGSSAARLQSIVSSVFSDRASMYWFQDDFIRMQYNGEIRLANAFLILSALAVSISSAGLYGMLALAAAGRAKELAIRRIHGARLLNVAGVLAAAYVWPLTAAAAIAWAAAAYFLDGWLEQYALRVELSMLLFLMATALAIALSALIVLFMSVRVCRVPPGHTLQSE